MNIVELLKRIIFPVEIEVFDFISSGKGFTKVMVDTSFLLGLSYGVIVHQDNTNPSIRNTQ